MRCAYCSKEAVGEDAIGIPACDEHMHYADDYFERRTGHKPDVDTFLYCDQHCDMWEPGCERCEQCSQHHYNISVAEFLDSPMARMVVISI